MLGELPALGDERQCLHASLRRHRRAAAWKLEGLHLDQLQQPLVPSGTSMLGTIKHLASIEFGWFASTFDQPSEWIPWDPDNPDADTRIEPGQTIHNVIAFYHRAQAAADQVITDFSLDESRPTLAGLGDGSPVTLRWILIHVLEDTIRHTGHLDILRETIDGQTGDHPPQAAIE